mmetsp:Transcript_22014/g.49328  ORF Transcript_22014/g.49328 Transcript_22014/m.49328 type:complete len:356 (+) Transcript_22014:201-1268(+)
MIGNHCFSTSPMQSSVTRHRPKQLRNAGRPAHNDGTRRGSSSLASSSSSPLAAAASASAPPPLATKGRKTSATPSRRGVVVAALLAAVFGSCPTGCSSLGVSRQPPRQPQRCGRQTGQRPTTKSTATTTATGGTPGIPFFRRSPSVPCAKAARGNKGEEDEEFSVEENKKRVPVTIRYSEDSGLKPYYLTVAKRVKDQYPDVRRREQRSLDRLQPRNLRGRRRREDRGEVQADPDRQHLCQHERDGRGDREGQEAPEALDGLRRARSGGDRGREGRRRPGRVQPVAAGAPETKSDGTPAEQEGKDNRGRRTGLRETAGVQASARKQTTVCVRTHCSNPKGGLKNIENHEITHTNE